MMKAGTTSHNNHYLNRFEQVISLALAKHPRTLAARIDLHLPNEVSRNDKNVISRFTDAVKAKVKADRKRSKKTNPKAHDSEVHYIWVKESNQTGNKVHYHVLLMFNKDAYWTLGSYSARDNLSDIIIQAWCSALSVDKEKDRSLVYFPRNPCYHINKNALTKTNDYQALLDRINYMAKHRTKQYSNQARSFGCSVNSGVLMGKRTNKYMPT
ncbi:TPA: inovirus Gp2 family protein [Salmonella enterica]|uniref:Inovirus Gp2 family protein n=1 Tax=Salmonella enterica TaxID=28901 RepID=A0A763MQE2_SALER|nr:inovirus Gp2 family protein [Salmonella enterica]HAG4415565.1 inovirus Gp2 family protein [Salmonella enterica]HAG4423098.1 inovirus Gp2 family protein [Salmonella enterica]HAG4424409.1 inovirus Gp2 family protein [Salmonella enterica]